MSSLIYDISLFSYHSGIRVASLFNEKAKLWVEGRRNWRELLTEKAKKLPVKGKQIWFHVSSLGEFEQARPVMEALKKEGAGNIILSFYSPSGYENAKAWKGADIITYLPEDNAKNAQDFLDIIKPDLAVFVKYDLWYHYLNQAQKKAIPCLLISARFYKDQIYFKSWGSWYKKMLFKLKEILVQDEASFALLKAIHYDAVINTGDTRFDRVMELSKRSEDVPHIEDFIGDNKVLIAGSTWPLDERIMLDYIKDNPQNLKVIIAPHDVGRTHINALEEQFEGKAILYSSISKRKDEHILIIDSIGLLSRLYRYATISYIGGAFKEGLHNILEPAAFGVPVITGPDHEGFLEGPAMEKKGGLFRVNTIKEFNAIMLKLTTDEVFYQRSSTQAKAFIQEHCGASEKTLSIIENYLS
jgi:3-deoxy-D-manno-octulosonic-acid transferase